MNILIVTHAPDPMAGYMAGLVISVLILGYLVYTLIKPEKF